MYLEFVDWHFTVNLLILLPLLQPKVSQELGQSATRLRSCSLHLCGHRQISKSTNFLFRHIKHFYKYS